MENYRCMRKRNSYIQLSLTICLINYPSIMYIFCASQPIIILTVSMTNDYYFFYTDIQCKRRK